MSEFKGTPGPWSVRKREMGGHLNDCFVTAADVNGYPYDAEILGDDEYHEQSGGIARKLADCNLIAAAPDLLEALEKLLHFTFIERWAMKGLDDGAQQISDQARAALAKAQP